jgi:dihydropteroate synthase
MYSLNCKDRLLVIDRPVVMGVLNITPDSFYKGSRIQSEEELIMLSGNMLDSGATILDLGGLSSRPGAGEISISEEIARVVPAIQIISDKFPGAFISIDSYRPEVARAAIHAGAVIINDIGAGATDDLVKLAASEGLPYISMHMRGKPDTMEQLTRYEDVVTEVLDYFIRRKQECIRMGIKDLIIDPGFGFAKTIRQNFLLLKHLKLLKILDLPVMVGLSRKATIYKTLGIQPENALNGSTVLHTLAVENGAAILRAHDVKEAVETIRLWKSYADA